MRPFLKHFAKAGTILFSSVGSRNDIVKTRVENDLHASVHLGARNDARVNLVRDTGMNACLQLLAREETKLEGKFATDQPRHERYRT